MGTAQSTQLAKATKSSLSLTTYYESELEGIKRDELGSEWNHIEHKAPRVLAIDGGGTRGVIPIMILERIERETGKKIHQLFDLIVGTSTGGLLAAGYGMLDFSSQDARDLYSEENMIRIFPSGFRNKTKNFTSKLARYPASGIEQVLKDTLTRCGEEEYLPMYAKPAFPKVCVVATVYSEEDADSPFLFRNFAYPTWHRNEEVRHRGTANALVWHACRASTSAVTYFPAVKLRYLDEYCDMGAPDNDNDAPASNDSEEKRANDTAPDSGSGMLNSLRRASSSWKKKRPDGRPIGTHDHRYKKVVLCDGGQGYNNPSIVALDEAGQIWEGNPPKILVSLGTGKLVGGDISARDRKAHPVRVVMEMAMRQTSTENTHKQVQRSLFGNKTTTYLRLNPEVPPDVALDVRDSDYLDMLRDNTEAYLESKPFQDALRAIKELCILD